jgi:hypothetical protein
VAAVVLDLSPPGKFIVGPGWLEPALELLLVAGLWGGQRSRLSP